MEGERVLENVLVRVQVDAEAVGRVLAEILANGPVEGASRVVNALCAQVLAAVGGQVMGRLEVALTCDDLDVFQTVPCRAPEEGNGHSAVVGIAGLPDDLIV